MRDAGEWEKCFQTGAVKAGGGLEGCVGEGALGQGI